MLFFNWESSVNDWHLVLLQHQPGLQELQNHVVSPGSSCKFEAHSRLPLSHSSHLPVTLGGSRSCLGSGCLQTSSASAATLSVETLDCLVHCQSCRSNTDCSELPSIQVKCLWYMWSTNPIPAGTTCSSLRLSWNRAVAGTGSGTLCRPLRDEHSPTAENTGFRSSSMAISLMLSLFFRSAPPAWPQQQLSCDKNDRPMKHKSNWRRLSLLKWAPQEHHSLLLFYPCLLQLCADTCFALWVVCVYNFKKLPRILVLPITHAWK